MAKRKYDPKQRQELLEEFEASGLGVMEFAKRKGVSHSTLISWRNKSGGAPRKRGKQGPVRYRCPHKLIRAKPHSKNVATDTKEDENVGKAFFLADLIDNSKNSLHRWVSAHASVVGRKCVRSQVSIPGRHFCI